MVTPFHNYANPDPEATKSAPLNLKNLPQGNADNSLEDLPELMSQAAVAAMKLSAVALQRGGPLLWDVPVEKRTEPIRLATIKQDCMRSGG